MDSEILIKTGAWWWPTVLHPDSVAICSILPGRPSCYQSLGRAYMENNCSWKSAERVSLEADLRNWFAGQGVYVESAARAVHLLDASVLLAQPRPSHWNRKGNFGVQERCRYL